MGESVAEATLITWLKEVGDSINEDESVVEIATDKVDSDVPSEFSGKLIEKRFKKDDIIKVGEIIAVIESDKISVGKNQEPEIISEDKDDSSIIQVKNQDSNFKNEFYEEENEAKKIINRLSPFNMF